MLLTVPIQRVVSKYGSSVTAKKLRLTACGMTIEDARMDLEQGITAWCRALEGVGLLEEALRRANLYVESNGTEDLRIATVFEGVSIEDE